MPVIDIYMPTTKPPEHLLEEIASEIQSLLCLPYDRVWVLWHTMSDGCYFRPNWQRGSEPSGPIVKMRCKSDYSLAQVQSVMVVMVKCLSKALHVSPESVFIIADPVERGRLYVRGQIWE